MYPTHRDCPESSGKPPEPSQLQIWLQRPETRTAPCREPPTGSPPGKQKNSIQLFCCVDMWRWGRGGTLIKVLRIEWWTHRVHWNVTMVPTDPSSMVMVTWLCLGLCQPLIVDRNPCYFLSLQASLTAEPTSVSSVWLQLTALFRSSHLPRSHFAASKEGTSGPLTIFKKHPQLLIDKVLKAKHSSSWSWASTLFGFIPTTVLL